MCKIAFPILIWKTFWHQFTDFRVCPCLEICVSANSYFQNRIQWHYFHVIRSFRLKKLSFDLEFLKKTSLLLKVGIWTKIRMKNTLTLISGSAPIMFLKFCSLSGSHWSIKLAWIFFQKEHSLSKNRESSSKIGPTLWYLCVVGNQFFSASSSISVLKLFVFSEIVRLLQKL